MPSNEQRRATAKRKLERQLANRAERARKRRQLTIAGSVLGVVVVVAAGIGGYFLTRSDDSTADQADASLSSTPVAGELPAAKPKAATVDCAYRDGVKPADKPVQKPSKTTGIPTTGADATLSMSIDTSVGPIGVTLDNAASPCTVNSFASLASQGFYNGTDCHRLTAGEGLKVLQCGDPTGSGSGGPGYEYDNEYPTDQYDQMDPASGEPVPYQRGVLAMANAGPGTNGSQFFLVYGDSQLPPQYTIFGKVDDASLPTLDRIAAIGTNNANGPGDGAPNEPITLSTVQID
ncbi:peptidylprolyl isomerase [Nocardia sp. NPDC050697]|uniref:peptidylprolyl isomerase n=1 Tax=Nocardia sp. NPDC050697 TaxID=3155158 RepID=UPI0033DB9072